MNDIPDTVLNDLTVIATSAYLAFPKKINFFKGLIFQLSFEKPGCRRKESKAYKILPIFTGETRAASGTIKNTTFLMDSEER